MRQFAVLCALWVGLAAVSSAQEYPKWEVFTGYSHEIADVSRSTVNMDGFHFSAAQNVNHWFGGLLDVAVHFARENGQTVDSESVAFGPRFAYRKSKALTPSGHVALGIVHGSQGYLGNSTSGTHFAVVAGGALDYHWKPSVAFRVIQGDYVRTYFQSLPRNNVQLATGLVVRF